MCLGKPHCLLIIDDSAYVRHTLRRVFEAQEGWEVCYEAVDGQDGVEQAIKYSPCAIVLDLSMPKMDGIEAARLLRSNMPKTPVFMFTNFVEDPFLQQEIAQAGITRVIPKTDAPTLIAAVKAAVA